ncbi:MAG: N-acetylgalactosamine 6-sulfate sulfatase (GALNS), partial [Lentisphaerae bacterium]
AAFLSSQPALQNLPVAAAEAEKPNIVFIFADDWGWGDLSCHGHPWIKTPNIDRIAREGIDFTQAYVLSPVCSPSRAAALTGKFPSRFNILGALSGAAKNHQRRMADWLDPTAPNVFHLLKKAGYRTGHFGKWHLTIPASDAPRAQDYGIDEFCGFKAAGPDKGWKSAGLFGGADAAVEFIRKNKDRPFYVNLWLHEVHVSHIPTTESMEQWKHLDKRKQVYSAVISDGDKAVGKILDVLDQEGLTDRTIVIFSSDNGPAAPAEKPDERKHRDHGKVAYNRYYSIGSTAGMRGHKATLFEGGVRLPLLVRWPGHAPAGMKNDTTVITTIDFLPTFCAIAGVELPPNFACDGENMLAAFKGEKVIRKKPLFWEYRSRLAVRDGEWKLIASLDGKQLELYRLSVDREERNNLVSKYPEITARLKKMVLEWKATLPEQPDPRCVTKSVQQPAADKTGKQKPGRKRQRKDKPQKQAQTVPEP